MAAIPKYRPSYTLPQLQAIKLAIESFKETHGELPLELEQVSQSIEIFMVKIGVGAKLPAYIQTRQVPVKVTLEDLGATEEDVNKQTYETIEDCKRAYISLHTIYMPMGFPAPADLQGACQAWLTYCTENDLDPMKEAGLETKDSTEEN
ncbi:hypothetical protein D3C78_768080 [compost metagenome]